MKWPKIRRTPEELANVVEKVCQMCRLSLPIKKFHKNRSVVDGHCYACAMCVTAKKKEKYHQNLKLSEKYIPDPYSFPRQ